MILGSILTIVFFLPKQPRFTYEFEKSKVWMHENLVSPYNFAILKTQAELDKDRENALASVYPVYNQNTDIAEQQISQFVADLPEKWQNSGLDTVGENMESYETVGRKLLQAAYIRGLSTITNQIHVGQQVQADS